MFSDWCLFFIQQFLLWNIVIIIMFHLKNKIYLYHFKILFILSYFNRSVVFISFVALSVLKDRGAWIFYFPIQYWRKTFC